MSRIIYLKYQPEQNKSICSTQNSVKSKGREPYSMPVNTFGFILVAISNRIIRINVWSQKTGAGLVSICVSKTTQLDGK